jgi:hypothetical protein
MEPFLFIRWYQGYGKLATTEPKSFFFAATEVYETCPSRVKSMHLLPQVTTETPSSYAPDKISYNLQVIVLMRKQSGGFITKR